MFLAVIMVLLFLGIMGGMGYLVYTQAAKSNPNNVGGVSNKDISTAQDFLPFENIGNGMIKIDKSRYRGIIEVTSTNYFLKTGPEREIIEMAFQRFVNSLDYSITFHIQTRLIDSKTMLESFEKDVDTVIEKYPNLLNYGEYSKNKMKNLGSVLGTRKQKRKFIILSFDGEDNIDELDEHEKEMFVAEKLFQRASLIIDDLYSMGLTARILDTKDLIELLYAAMHREGFSVSMAEGIADGSLTEAIVFAGNPIRQKDPLDRIDWILKETQDRLKVEVGEAVSSNQFISDIISGYYNQICDMRSFVGAKYSSNEKFDNSSTEDTTNIIDNNLIDFEKIGEPEKNESAQLSQENSDSDDESFTFGY